MRFKLSRYFIAVGLTCVSVVFANEAPVVDAQQQQQNNNVASTQPEESSGGGWQQMASDSNQSNTQQNQTAPVSNIQPTPVQSYSQPSETSVPVSGSVDMRVSRLEQQMSNYSQMNLPQQVSDLRQQVSSLQGQIEVDQHDLSTLTNQQKLYYQDIEQQLSQLKPTTPTAGVTTPSTKMTSPANSKAFTSAGAENAALTPASTVSTTDNVTPATTTPTTQTAVSNQTGTALLGDTDAYGKAFHALSKKHFTQAQTDFTQYLSVYPQGHFAVNAHFWLGEIALMNQKYDAATKQFQTVVAQYPTSSKVSDAKLKIAMIHAAIGKTNIARREYAEIRKAYPGTTAAQLASIRLQQLTNATSVSMQ